MKFIKTQIDECYIVEPETFADERGFFLESYNKKKFDEIIGEVNFVQDNHSRSLKGTLRGLHFQSKFPQGKLVRVLNGEVLDVAVDLRKDSKTFGNSVSVILSSHNKKIFWVPPGFAHGFQVLSESADFVYKCTDFYHKDDQHGIRWDDKSLKINWPIKEPILSKKDAILPLIKDIKI
tara:strand:- start:704 stop:1237 length:534 start_codon:yes stop_codon:yes gene_type:complete